MKQPKQNWDIYPRTSKSVQGALNRARHYYRPVKLTKLPKKINPWTLSA